MSDNLPAEIPGTSLPSVRDALAAWTSKADELAEQGDVAALGTGLGRFRGFRRAIADLERHIEDHAARLMDSDRFEGPGLLLELSKPSTIRSDWQSEALLNDIERFARFDPETGEARDSAVALDLFIELIRRYVPFTKSLPWRAGALKKGGYQVDEWCHEKSARRTVKVTLGEDET